MDPNPAPPADNNAAGEGHQRRRRRRRRFRPRLKFSLRMSFAQYRMMFVVAAESMQRRRLARLDNQIVNLMLE